MIRVENLWYTYDGGNYVLRDVSLEIVEGEIYYILGDNGSGKTTLIRHLNGLLKPSRGRVLVDGLDTRETPVSRLAEKVSIVFQNPEKMFYMPTVIEEISTTLRNFGVENPDQRAEEILREYGLSRYRDRSPFTLSGGEKRILSIAIMTGWSPRYLVLDEPTIGLDGDYRRRLQWAIDRHLSRGGAVVIVTHDMELVLEREGRVVILSGGQVVYRGYTQELIDLDPGQLGRYGLVKPTYARSTSYMKTGGVIRDYHGYCGVFAEVAGVLDNV